MAGLYWGREDVTVKNFLAAILGNKTAITGGSGKVVDSGPNNHIFIYYAGHGASGVLACHSGSIFEGLLPDGLNIYATTASNAKESSWGTYCPWKTLGPPSEYETSSGDLYSVAWMKDRTANDNYDMGSHVMLYGDIGLGKENLFLYIGTDPANDKYTFVSENSLRPPSKAIKQHDADLLYFWDKDLYRCTRRDSPCQVQYHHIA
ncbi:hypothetical protein Q3G72_034228 [Acer saccharum]|nr:hypothetical protein Q3G72_034228 [Acer saccharum]